MNKVGNREFENSGYENTSVLSPPWTTAVVFLLIVFSVMLIKISLIG